ncbi:MAG: aldehyde dehydrogenase family protein [Phycisphaerales bacterium]|jgi:acyl-CoA reductase-like NAD-dependent aldehyde dehydrogenase|nr:aldehyde dehydrogenase family protein [Phycisphaerales bacterium]
MTVSASPTSSTQSAPALGEHALFDRSASAATLPPTPPPWPLPARLAWLKAFTRAIITHERALTDAIIADVGKPAWQAVTGDVMTLLAACAWHRRHAKALLKPRSVPRAWTFMPGTALRLQREPLGTVAIIATWNYPVQLLGIQLVQALLGGNRVIVKPSERAPRSQRLLLQLARDAGADATILRWTEPTRDAGPALLDAHARKAITLDHVIFTGSTAVGQHIARWAAEHFVGTTLELSGNDSAIVLDDADVHLAAKSIAEAAAMNCGQTCLAPRRVLVQRSIYDAFTKALATHVSTIAARSTTPQRLIDDAARARCDAMAHAAMHTPTGARWLTPSESPSSAADTLRVLIDVPRTAELVTCATQEHFGPLVAVLPIDDEADALAVHRTCTQHLMTSIFTSRPARAEAMIRSLALSGSGVIAINDCVLPGGHPALGITGHARSGWGTSRGPLGLLALTRPIYITRTTWPRLPLGPIPSKRLEQMRSALKWMFR